MSCSGPESSSYEQLKGSAQGTTFSIVYEPVSEDDYTIEVDSIFKAIDKSMSLWDSTSVISQFNSSVDGVTIDPMFKTVYERAKEIHEETDGSLDITIGPIIRSWGFIRENGLPVPPASEVEIKLSSVGMEKVALKDKFLSKKLPSVEIDVNAVAQGYSVDVLVDFLEEKGVKNLLVEIGGEVRSVGVNQYNEAWKVGIERPDYNKGIGRNGIKAVVALSGKSLVTSGSNRKYVEVDGKKYSHTIDPKTGYPVTHNLLSVSVIADNAMDADAYATAFMVLGVEKSLQLSKKLGLEIFCIYDDEGEFKTTSSPGFDQYILDDV